MKSKKGKLSEMGEGFNITTDIVKAHGGTMSVQSKPEETVFTIELNG